MTRILVAYASKHHSTAEIAEAIGQALGESRSFEIDVRPIDTLDDLSGYDAFVVGSAVYLGRWQPSAGQFLKNHEATLSQHPVWFFSSGPTGQGDPKAIMKGWDFPESLRPIANRIRPRGIVLFHGKLERAELSFTERTIVSRAPMGDSRDWNVVLAWAESISQALQPE